MRALTALGVALLLTGCAALPESAGRTPSVALPVVGNSLPVQLARAPATAAPDSSGIRALPGPRVAFTARVLLARAAERSLDVQTYIWRDDTTGVLLLEELWNAAERGVRVRLLLDDLGTRGMDGLLAALDAHPGIEVRLFNPFPGRRFKMLSGIPHFTRLNRRMHNKSFTADGSATLVGGRNVGDEYFGADPRIEFTDLDVLAAGPVAGAVGAAFDQYWNAAAAVPLAQVVAPADDAAVTALQARFTATRTSAAARRYAGAVLDMLREEALPLRAEDLEWVPVQAVYDDPAKTLGKAGESGMMLIRLLAAVGDTDSSLEIISPYFVPGAVGTAVLGNVARDGLRVRVVTNSLASSDAMVVHAGYAKRRKALLRAGVQIHELKPVADGVAKPVRREKHLLVSGSASSLHTKTFVFDQAQVFVGSFNLDQRSLHLNTEMGLVIDSPALARQVTAVLDDNLPGAAYEVRLQPDGHGLLWIERGPQGERTYTWDPQAGVGRRLGVRLVSWLPIEWML